MGKKKLYLICNSHIDPIWLWTWDEGMAATISTFKSAADLAEEFDYVFCHGESVLYEAIEKYAPDLFARIQKLVKQGKWKITCGWYLQPDCVMPSGESLVRQIKVGQKYFKEKFDVDLPTTATSYDCFGHSIGLVQILKKCGFDSYIICRPKDFQFDYPGKFFKWVGPDGSSVIASFGGEYLTLLGEAKEHIEETVENSEDIDYMLWGVGNHGGGPSRKDLTDIENLHIDGVEIVHGTPEQVFADDIKISGEIHRSLTLKWTGGYSNMTEMKQAHKETENMYYAIEKMLAVAKMNGFAVNDATMQAAEKQILFTQFHDIFPGMSIPEGMKEGMDLLTSARNIVRNYRTDALMYFVMNERKAGEGEYPIFVFNYLPYEMTTPIEAEFSLANQNWDDANILMLPEIYDEEGNKLPLQQVKEASTLCLDWRKKIVFEGRLKPLSITRFTLKTTPVPVQKKEQKELDLTTFLQERTSLLQEPVQLVMYEDSADSWAMASDDWQCLGRNPQAFARMTREQASEFCAVQDISPVHIIEDGELYTAVEDCVTLDNTNAVIEYRCYKKLPYVDIKVTVEFAEKNKLLRLKIPAPKGIVVGDGAYVVEEKLDGEVVFQKWVGTQKENGEIFAVINDCLYGGKAEDGYLYLTLLRGAGQCMLLVKPERQLYPDDRYLPRIDSGKCAFTIRLYQGGLFDVCKEAELFNQKPYALNIFPTGNENRTYEGVRVDGDLLMPVCKSLEDGSILVRLYNPEKASRSGQLSIGKAVMQVKVGAAEVVSVVYKDGEFTVYHDEMYL